jgi:hypothetical protein
MWLGAEVSQGGKTIFFRKKMGNKTTFPPIFSITQKIFVG